jgi:hypothetical protein
MPDIATFPGIPTPQANNLFPTVVALVEVVEILTGQRKNAPPQLQFSTAKQSEETLLRLQRLQLEVASIKSHLGL